MNIPLFPCWLPDVEGPCFVGGFSYKIMRSLLLLRLGLLNALKKFKCSKNIYRYKITK